MNKEQHREAMWREFVDALSDDDLVTLFNACHIVVTGKQQRWSSSG